MNNKHTAVFVALGLIAVFVAIAIWYAIAHKSGAPEVTDTATTTPVTAGFEAPAVSIVENGKYYEIEAEYPSATPLLTTTGATANAEAVVAMKNFVQKIIDSFKDNGDFANLTAEDVKIQGLDTRKYTLGLGYEMYTGKQTVSYVFTMNEDTGGAHGITYFRTFTFDTKTGESVELSDLFVPGALYLDRISKETRKDIPLILKELRDGDAGPTTKEQIKFEADWITTGTIAEVDSFQNFAIDGNILQIIFPQYQVAPYSAGVITDPIPLSRISDILEPMYIP